MIYLYPANKMENLLLVLNKISQLSPLGVFNQEVIVVQNAGMQHWLNLAIAQQRGISMNMRYALPAQFLWKLIRSLASEDKVPEQSPYSREVLCWRIHQLLAQDKVISDDDFSQATQYWRGKSDENLTADNSHQDAKHAQLKRYQLATQLADLYEQYLIFRPQWLDSWQQGHFDLQGLEATATSEHKWQGKLWRLLIAQLPYNPVELLNDAIANINNKKDLIPSRISFFGLNTMAPMWLNFINALSEQVEVHFFHLNPCFSYWGDIISEKTAIAKLSQWSSGVSVDESSIDNFVGNPLLASLGQQGREFISMLQDYSTIDVELFEQASDELLTPEYSAPEQSLAEKPVSESPTVSVLHQLQNDILELSDAREQSQHKVKKAQHDDSIVITSCHSALREVQALHDYLLHQFNQDNSLTPKDILVMCPQIEQYAPYVNAVFTRGWQDIAGEVPPLPCSIADRSAKDSDPLVAAFTELLTLPDSRFGVSQLLAFLRLPTMANQFAINSEDLVKISAWLEQATVHWGLNDAHKKSLLGQHANNSFTWQQGLSRLLRGFAYADHEHVYQQQLLLSNVEGSDGVLLGKLMLFIEQLHYFSGNLQRSRTPAQWQVFLLAQLSLLFSRVDADNTSNENSLMIIEQAIAGLVEHCQQANFTDDIELLIVVDYLSQHFSQGDASKQFMVGQVTFCSMLPMRSIPFKIIAVLGLNDGEFPRQRQALGFDLMSLAKAELGDRSRRGDDRYLFLEAIISARKALYLSYQGRNIKNNHEQQPSLVLKELMEYLTQGYGWQFSTDDSDQSNEDESCLENLESLDKIANLPAAQQRQSLAIYQVAMQAFSAKNYRGKWPSFDANWLALGQCFASDLVSTGLLLEQSSMTDTDEITISCQQLARFYQHPAKMFAQQQLNLYFDNNHSLLDDVEPFSVNHLQSYLLRQDLLSAALLPVTTAIEPAATQAQFEQVLTRAQLSGKFPDLPTMSNVFSDYQQDVLQFSQTISELGCDNPDIIDCQLTLNLNDFGDNAQPGAKVRQVIITSQLAVKGDQLVHYRSSSAKAKDKFIMYLHQLIVQVWQDKAIADNANGAASIKGNDEKQRLRKLAQVTGSVGLYFNSKAQKVEQFSITPISDAKAKLMNIITLFITGQQQVLLLNGELAEQVFTPKRGQLVDMTQARFEALWLGNINAPGLGDDDYLHYFWPECPQYQDHQADLNVIYQDLYQVVTKDKTKAKPTAKASAKSVKTTAKPSKEAN